MSDSISSTHSHSHSHTHTQRQVRSSVIFFTVPIFPWGKLLAVRWKTQQRELSRPSTGQATTLPHCIQSWDRDHLQSIPTSHHHLQQKKSPTSGREQRAASWTILPKCEGRADCSSSLTDIQLLLEYDTGLDTDTTVPATHCLNGLPESDRRRKGRHGQ
jgi:hypothetical protein